MKKGNIRMTITEEKKKKKELFVAIPVLQYNPGVSIFYLDTYPKIIH